MLARLSCANLPGAAPHPPGTDIAIPTVRQVVLFMNRTALSCVILTAMLAVGCGSKDSASPSPTNPSPSTPAPSNPSPTNPSCAPGVPGNLTVTYTGVGNTRVFNWNVADKAVDYFIGVGTASGASDLIYTNTTQPTYTWTGQSMGNLLYYARVYARNSCGSSANSNEISFR